MSRAAEETNELHIKIFLVIGNNFCCSKYFCIKIQNVCNWFKWRLCRTEKNYCRIFFVSRDSMLAFASLSIVGKLPNSLIYSLQGFFKSVLLVRVSYFVLLFIAASYKNIERYSQQLFRANLKRSTLILIILGIIVFAVIIMFGFSSTMNIKENVEKIV